MRRRFRRHFTAGGRILAITGAISLVAGLDAFRTMLAGLFGVAVALTLANALVGMLTRVRLRGQLRLPHRAVAGSRVTASVILTNASRRTAYDVDVTLDRVLPGLGASSESHRCERLAPGETVRLEIGFEARRRGAYRLGPAYAGTTYPLGIVRQGNAVGDAQQLLVTPRIHPMRSLRLASGLRYQPGGVPLASQTGESSEFIGVREYRPGDSLRKIHWKLWARRGQPVVREHSQEHFARIGLIVDTYHPGKKNDCFEAAMETAASVASYLGQQDAVVDFFAAGPELYLLSMGRHLAPLERVIELLACVEPCRKPPYEGLEAQLGGLLPRLSAVLMITFEESPPQRAFLERLRQSGPPLRVLVVDRSEFPAFDGASRIDPDNVAASVLEL